MNRLPALSVLALTAALLVAGCNSAKKHAGNSLDAMDNELVEGAAINESDLGAAIKVDPKRAAKASRGEAPATSEDGGAGTCLGRNASKLTYANDWARKLPGDLPLHPQAHLTEAAGHSGGCDVRAASFTVPDEPEAVLAWYEDRAGKAGYDAGRTTRDGQVWLAGTKGDAAFTIMTSASRAGTAVDYIWTKGD
jgi:hypothetical protein